MTAIFHLVDILETQNILGESAVWHQRTGHLWWTDIQARTLFCYHPGQQQPECFATPARLCSFAFTRQEGTLIAAFEHGVARYHPATQHCDWIFRLPDSDPRIRFNDGHMDRQGRFWAGTMMEGPFDTLQPLGRLYRFDRDGGRVASGERVKITNALAFSPDGRKLYFADSPRRTIFVCELAPDSGLPASPRLFAQTPQGVQPDGAIVDAEGFLWNAHWGGGCVVRYTPDGRIAARIRLPVSQPTSLAFGGPQMKHLFVTTARDGLDGDALLRQPQAGNLFVYETDIAGLADAEFVW